MGWGRGVHIAYMVPSQLLKATNTIWDLRTLS